MNYREYAEAVVAGSIISCEFTKLACSRFLDDLNRDDLVFKEKKVRTLIQFASVLHHYTGSHSGEPFILEAWQEMVAASIFGFYYKDTGRRKYTSSYIELARKQGKTFLAALFCLFALIADGEDAAEVLLAANSKEQARIAFEMTQELSRQLDPREKELKVYRNEIKFSPNVSKLKVLAADDSKLDGFNCSFGLLDEYHAAGNSKVRDVIKSSMGMRKNPHLATITTAGFNKSAPCYELRSYGIEVLKGIKEDDSFFCLIYTLDEGDDWTDERNWYKCSPNLDITVSMDWLRSQVQQAKQNPSDEVGVKTKNLNMWCDSSNVWIPERHIKQQMKHIDLADFIGRDDIIVYAGVDLSSVSDLTAVSYLVYDTNNNNYYFKTYYYLPETCVEDKFNKELYKIWAAHGELKLTKGNVVDYNYITNDLKYWYEQLNIRKIAYDAWNASQWSIQCKEEGLPIEPFSQSIGNFNRATKEIERLLLSGDAFLDRNNITRFCFDNVELRVDMNGNCLDVNTMIPTTSGFKPMKDVEVGDYVFSYDGTPTKVVYTTPINYDRDCYEITFSNGGTVVADSGHQWYIEVPTTKKIDGKRRCVSEYQYRDTEWVYKHWVNGQGRKWLHTVMNGAVEYPAKSYTIDPYILGVWLGDGSMHGSVFSVNHDDTEIYDYITSVYGEPNINQDRDKKCYAYYYRGGLRSALKDMGLLGNKYIPDEYFEGSIEQRLSLLQGLMDTDGTVNKHNQQCSITQVRKDIIEGVIRLLDSLGIRHGNIREFEVDGGKYYGVDFYTTQPVFRLKRKLDRLNKYTPSKKLGHNVIMDVKKVESRPTKCITVEDEKHLFLATDKYIVVGNCKPDKSVSHKKIDGVIAKIEALGVFLLDNHSSGDICYI